MNNSVFFLCSFLALVFGNEAQFIASCCGLNRKFENLAKILKNIDNISSTAEDLRKLSELMPARFDNIENELKQLNKERETNGLNTEELANEIKQEIQKQTEDLKNQNEKIRAENSEQINNLQVLLYDILNKLQAIEKRLQVDTISTPTTDKFTAPTTSPTTTTPRSSATTNSPSIITTYETTPEPTLTSAKPTTAASEPINAEPPESPDTSEFTTSKAEVTTSKITAAEPLDRTPKSSDRPAAPVS